MKIHHILFSILVIAAFSYVSFTSNAEASCWLDPNGGGGQNCNYSLNYVPMIDLPGVTNPNSSTSFASYASALYSVAIVVAALLAVIRLVIAGAKYMMTDVVSGKGEAINDIKGSLLGLLIIISAFVILNTINPNLTKISIVGTIPGTQISGGGLSSLIVVGSGSGNTSTNPLSGYNIMAIGDKIRNCQSYTAAVCATNICTPAGGTVITNGLLNPSGSTQMMAGIPVCLIKAGQGNTTTPPPSGSITFSNGLILVPGKQYTAAEQQNIIAAATADNKLLGAPFAAALGTLQEKQTAATQYCNSQYQNSTAYIISRIPPAGATAICVGP